MNDVGFIRESGWVKRRSEAEKAAIATLKWIESEKVGYDIGIHRALWIWVTTRRLKWLREWGEANPERD